MPTCALVAARDDEAERVSRIAEYTDGENKNPNKGKRKRARGMYERYPLVERARSAASEPQEGATFPHDRRTMRQRKELVYDRRIAFASDLIAGTLRYDSAISTIAAVALAAQQPVDPLAIHRDDHSGLSTATTTTMTTTTRQSHSSRNESKMSDGRAMTRAGSRVRSRSNDISVAIYRPSLW